MYMRTLIIKYFGAKQRPLNITKAKCDSVYKDEEYQEL